MSHQRENATTQGANHARRSVSQGSRKPFHKER